MKKLLTTIFVFCLLATTLTAEKETKVLTKPCHTCVSPCCSGCICCFIVPCKKP